MTPTGTYPRDQLVIKLTPSLARMRNAECGMKERGGRSGVIGGSRRLARDLAHLISLVIPHSAFPIHDSGGSRKQEQKHVTLSPGHLFTLSPQHLFHDTAMHIGQPKLTALKAECQALVIDPQAMQDRRV